MNIVWRETMGRPGERSGIVRCQCTIGTQADNCSLEAFFSISVLAAGDFI